MKVWEDDEVTKEKAAEVSVEEKIADKKKSDKKKDTKKMTSGKKQGPHQQQSPQTSHARKDLTEEPSKKAYLVHQEDERIPEGFNWDHYDPNRTSDSKAFVAQIFEDSTAEDEIVYAYYESQQFSPKKKEEEPVSTEEASQKAPIFDHSLDEESDDDNKEIRKLEYYKREFSPDRYNLYFAGKMEEIKERQAAKKKNHNAATVVEKVKPEENVRVIKKQVKEIPAIKVEKEADTEKIPEKCDNFDTETQRIETERVNRLSKSYSWASYVIDRIYPTVEGMEAFEEKKSEVKNTGKKHSTNYTRCPPPLEEV
ncbi:triadin-like [Helianthus annuus]|uniref:triadin-like n=1 Tax=Helianthus annuus TaxID=4232 RepID=UPI000B8F6D8F|nr:triadin-like [Helianthus annuus]